MGNFVNDFFQKKRDREEYRKKKEQEEKKILYEKSLLNLDDVLKIKPINRLSLIAIRYVDITEENAIGYHEEENIGVFLEIIGVERDIKEIKRYYLYNNSDTYNKICSDLKESVVYNSNALSNIAESLALICPVFPSISCVYLRDENIMKESEYISRYEPISRYSIINKVTSEVDRLSDDAIQRLHEVIMNWENDCYEDFFKQSTSTATKQLDAIKSKVEMRITRLMKEREKTKHKKILQYGKQGEAIVEYALEWLPEEYCVFEKGEKGIYLSLDGTQERKQEYDHIIIGPCGVVLIETKYYNGKIIIDSNGNWIREKENGKQIGEKNPIQQIERHHMIIESILGITDIHDIICIAHDNAIIIGVENSVVPIVKSDMLVHYIKSLSSKSGKIYNEMEKEEIVKKINKNRL